MKEKKVALPTIGIIGVGLMGLGIATNIQKNGYRLNIYEHSGNQDCKQLVQQGAQLFNDTANLVSQSNIIILCVTSSQQVEEIVFNDHLLNAISGKTLIDCSTSIPDSTQKVASAILERGGTFLDAPMTRTPKEAMEGRLNLIVGASTRTSFNKLLPLFETFAETITYAGEISNGHKLKLLHNFVSLGFSTILAEAIACAKKAGVDNTLLHDVLESGGGKSVVLDRFTPYMLREDNSAFRFSLNNAFKDLGYYSSMGDDLAAENRVAKAIFGILEEQVHNGNGSLSVPELTEKLI